MKRTFRAALLLALVAGINQISAAAESLVTISVEAKNPGAAIPPDFSGLSFEVSILLPNENGVRYFRPDNLPLINLFHTLGIKNLRIGGNTSDRDVRKLPAEADLDSLFQFAKSADVKVIYCLQLRNGDPQVASSTVKYILLKYAAQVDCFSIGQEPSAYPVEKKDTRAQGERMGAANEKFQYVDYAAAWKKFADVIIAENPGVKFCGPSVHNNGVWATKFLADFGQSNHVSLVTEHLYPGGAGGKVPTPENGIDRMFAGENSEMTNGFPRAYKKLHDSFVPAANASALPYRLEEVNNYFNGGATNVSNTFASALWGLDFMWWWAAHDCAGLNFHTGDKVAAGYELRPSKYTAFFSTTNGYLIRPLGYGIKTFDLGSHGKFLPLKISNADNLNLSAYAVRDDGKNIFLTIINKEHGPMARDARVSLTPAFREGELLRLSAPENNPSATTGETLGDAAIQSDGSWSGNWKSLGPPIAHGIDEGTFFVRIPATSAVVIKLHEN